MVSLATALKPLSPLSSFVKQHKTSNNNAFSTYCTYTYTNSGLFKREGAVPQKKYTFVGVHDASDQVESSWTIPLSEVVVVRKKKAFWQRSWNYWDVIRLVQFAGVHLLSLSAPFYFNWSAFRVFFWIVVINGICITLCYHRNLSHRSFDLPKWLEYLFAYGGLLAFQGDPIEWVSNHRYHHKHCDTQRDPHSPIQGFWLVTWIFDSGCIHREGIKWSKWLRTN
ncbi:hypothetical protein Rs2_24750 [Raphanus sativus]|nr:hypothetical protein Rs2_24750 [Raphanus sativus]